MLKKLFANKKMLILIVVLALVLVGTLIAVFTTNDSEEKGKSNTGIETGKDKDSETSEDDTDEVYNGEGLEVEDTLDESVYTIDGSGNWDGTSDDSSQKEQGNKTDETQSGDIEKEEADDKDNNAGGELDNDILVDDKVWGEIS